MKERKQNAIPTSAKRIDHMKLAEGSATGHSHAVVGDGAALFDLGNEAMVLDAPNGAVIQHEEHQAITLPPAIYDRSIVREYDHAAEEARQVVD